MTDRTDDIRELGKWVARRQVAGHLVAVFDAIRHLEDVELETMADEADAAVELFERDGGDRLARYARAMRDLFAAERAQRLATVDELDAAFRAPDADSDG